MTASLGATALQLFDFGQLSAEKIALAGSNSENITPFNFFPRLVYDYLSPVFNGLGEGIGSFYRGVGEGAGNIARGFGEGVGEGAGDVARGVGEGLRIRLRNVISNEKAQQKILEYAVNQNAQKQREIIELMRDSLREYQAKQIELQLAQIQSNWDLENWAGILSRQETENLLQEKKDTLLVLFSPPTISPDAPSSIQNNLPIDLESVGTTLAKYYPERNKQYAVKFYSGYFKRPIGDIIVEQLHGILAPIPTAIFYMDITDYACRFNVGFWGIQSQEVSIVSSPLWNWERTKKELMSSGIDEVESLRTIRQSMVNGNQLLASYLVDSYYLNLDPYYKLQFPKVSANLAQELTDDLAQKGIAQESIKPYVVQLSGIQQQEQQVYERELKVVAEETKRKRLWIENDSEHPLTIAIVYYNLQNEWEDTYWYNNFTPGKKSTLLSRDSELVLLNDHTLYYYAETTDGSNLVWSGNDLTRNLGNRTVKMSKSDLTHDENGFYLKLIHDSEVKRKRLWIENASGHPLRISIVYKNLQNEWEDAYGYTFAPDEKSTLLSRDPERVLLNNSTLYFYAETTDGSNLIWSGNDLTRNLGNRTIKMSKLELTHNENGFYLRLTE